MSDKRPETTVVSGLFYKLTVSFNYIIIQGKDSISC